MNALRVYGAVMRIRFQMLLQYRAAAIAGLFTQTFFGLVAVMAYDAFYRSTTAPPPIDFAETVTYVWLGQAFFAMQPWGVDGDIAGLIRNGNVAYELTRPLDLYSYWFARCIALRAAPTVLRAVPMFVLAGLCFGLQAPVSPASGLAFAAAMLGALLLTCALTMLMSISLLWTLSGEGLVYLVGVCAMILSGMVIPLPLLPDWAQAVLRALPFSGLVDTPFRLYLGQLPPSALLGVLGHQLGWTALLVILGRMLLARGCRRLVVQGG